MRVGAGVILKCVSFGPYRCIPEMTNDISVGIKIAKRQYQPESTLRVNQNAPYTRILVLPVVVLGSGL